MHHLQHTTLAFEREAKLLARLRHPALPVVSDYFAEDGAKFLAMQFIPGDDLAALLQQRGTPFPVATVIGWADTILGALEYLHKQQPPVIHRDIKPHNLKLTPSGEIVLLDFGIAKGNVSVMGQSATQSSVIAYTLHYGPLEQLQQASTDARSDLYALGVTLYQLLTNIILPPSALERAAARFQSRPDPLQPAHALVAVIPAPLSAALQRAMAIEMTDRYGSAAEMRRALREAMAASKLGAHPQPAATVGASAWGVAPHAAPQAPMEGTTVVAARPALARPPAVHYVPPATTAQSLSAAPLSLAGNTPAPLPSRRLLEQWMLTNLAWMAIVIALGLIIGPATLGFTGMAIGLTQWIVLRRAVPTFPTALWIVVNALMGPIAFLLGFLISVPTLPDPPLLYGVASGIVGGVIYGAAQWYVLQLSLPGRILWMLGQAAAWGLVVLLCYISIGFALAAGPVVGGFSGAILWYLLRTKNGGAIVVNRAP